MRKGMNPYTVDILSRGREDLQLGLGFVDLLPDVRALIREHTRSHFVVEQRWSSRVFGIVDRDSAVLIPLIQRIEFELAPRTTDSYAKFSMKITQCVDRKSPQFTQLITGLSEPGLTTLTQEQRQELNNWAREHEKMCQETFHEIVRLLVQSGKLLVVEPEGYYSGEHWRCHSRCVRTPGKPDLYVTEVPHWCIVTEQMLQEIRENLPSKFHMQLEEIPTVTTPEILSIAV